MAEGGGFLLLELGPEGGQRTSWDVGVRADVAPSRGAEAEVLTALGAGLELNHPRGSLLWRKPRVTY